MKDVLKKIFKFDFTPTIISYVLFMVLTALLVYVDTQPVGLGGSLIGLATVNRTIFDFVGKSVLWYNITQAMGIIAIIYVIGFAIYGLAQWVNRQKLRRVDKDLFVLGFIYFLILGCYIVFDIFIINFRPVLVTNVVEASYPSSHTLLVVCVMVTSIMQFHSRIKKKKVLRWVAEIVSAAVLIVTLVGRMLSGVNWFTDMLGALLLSVTLITFYWALVKRLKGNNKSAKPKVKKEKKAKDTKVERAERKAKRAKRAEKKKKANKK